MVFRLAYLDLTMANSKGLKVKVMNIASVKISKMVTDGGNIIIAIKYEVAYGLLISIFRFGWRLF